MFTARVIQKDAKKANWVAASTLPLLPSAFTICMYSDACLALRVHHGHRSVRSRALRTSAPRSLSQLNECAAERFGRRIEGLLPPSVETLDLQAER